MLSSRRPMIGTIELKPSNLWCFRNCDDSSLERLLVSYTQHRTLSDDLSERGRRLGLVAMQRLSWRRHEGESLVMQANLSQLADDLQCEYEALGEFHT